MSRRKAVYCSESIVTANTTHGTVSPVFNQIQCPGQSVEARFRKSDCTIPVHGERTGKRLVDSNEERNTLKMKFLEILLKLRCCRWPRRTNMSLALYSISLSERTLLGQCRLKPSLPMSTICLTAVTESMSGALRMMDSATTAAECPSLRMTVVGNGGDV